MLEDISRRIGARALFATHYLELTQLVDELPGVGNVHVVGTGAGRAGRLPLRRPPGPADRAYGIHVARLAGLPPWVADRAEALLATRPRAVTSSPAAALNVDRLIAEEVPGWSVQSALPGVAAPTEAERLAHALRALDLEAITPREALAWLWEQRDQLDV